MSLVRNDPERDPHHARRFTQRVPVKSRGAIPDRGIICREHNLAAFAVVWIEGNKATATRFGTIALRVGFCMRYVGPVEPEASLMRDQAPGASVCPRCHQASHLSQQERISTAGILVFGLLLLLCFPLCWIGLLIKEQYLVCSTCGMQLRAR